MAERDPRRDEGFTLVEIIVALGIFLVVTTALLPQMIAGIRAVSTADNETVLKGILQQEVDRLRGLPYRVSLGSDGSGTDEDVDLLDLYFPNVNKTAPTTVTCASGDGYAKPTAAWEGYVGTTSGRRCDYEPQQGVFFRTVDSKTDPRLGAIVIVRDVQFLSGGSTASPTPTAVPPNAGYNSDQAVTNYPPSTQVGVTVTVLYGDRGTTKARTLYTQIAKRDQGPTLVKTSVDVTSVEITSVAQDGAAQSLTAGVVDLEGTVGDISSASASLAGVVASTSTGDSTTSQLKYGDTYAAAAPPAPEPLDLSPDTPSWGGQPCAAPLCWGTSMVSSDLSLGVAADDGLPVAGSASGQLRASVTDTGSRALTFDNRGTADGMFALTGEPVVRLLGTAPGAPTGSPPAACPLGTGAGRLTGSGYLTTVLDSDSDSVRDTAACGSARSATLGILPVAWAPDGIVKVTLNRAYAWCTVTGGTPTGGAALDATVQVADGQGGYQPAVPVSAVTLNTAVGDRGPLGTWFQSWSVGTPSTYTDPAAGEVRQEMPGLTVTTKPLRALPADPAPTETPSASPSAPSASPSESPSESPSASASASASPSAPSEPEVPPDPDEQSAVITTIGAVSCSSVSAP